MTTGRVALLTAGAFALLLAARPPRPTGLLWGTSEERVSASDRAQNMRTATLDTLRAINQALWARHVRDSVTKVLARMPASARNQLLADPRIAPSFRQHMQTVYAQSRAQLGSASFARPMFVVLDSVGWSGQGRALWVEDSASAAPTCATVVRVSVSHDVLSGKREGMRELVRSLGATFPRPRDSGLCGFEAAFGAPSHAVRQWLRAREYYPLSYGYDLAARPKSGLWPYYDESGLTGFVNRFQFW